MKEQKEINETPKAVIADKLCLRKISVNKKKTLIVDDIKELTKNTTEATRLQDYQLETEEKLKTFLQLLINYETNLVTSKSDPFIQWIINNKRFKINEAYVLLKPKLVAQINELNKYQSTDISAMTDNLYNQCKQLNEEINQHIQSISLRNLELQELTNNESALSQLITTVVHQEKSLLDDFSELHLIEVEHYDSVNDLYMLSLIQKMGAFLKDKQCSKMDLMTDNNVINTLHLDDRDSIAFLINQSVEIIHNTKSLLKKNLGQILLDSEKYAQKQTILTDLRTQISDNYHKINSIIQNQPFGSLNKSINEEKTLYDNNLKHLSNHESKRVNQLYRKNHLNYYTILAKINSTLLSNLETIRDKYTKLRQKSNTADFFKLLALNVDEGTAKKIGDNVIVQSRNTVTSCAEIIHLLTNLRIKPSGTSKEMVYKEVLDALKEANKSFKPILAREKEHLVLNENLVNLRQELKEKLETINTKDLYKNHIFHSKVVDVVTRQTLIPSKEEEILAFINSKKKIRYCDIEVMRRKYENYHSLQHRLLYDMEQSISCVNQWYVNKLTMVINEIEAQLKKLVHASKDQAAYKQILQDNLTRLKQLNKPTTRVEFTQFYEKELESFKQQYQYLECILDTLEKDRKLRNEFERRRRLESNEVQCIVNFLDELLLADNPDVIINLKVSLESIKEEYIQLRINENQFHDAIESAINDIMLPTIHELVPFYDESNCKHYIRSCLKFINDLLEFLTQVIPIEECYKPQFFSTIPQEIQKCDLALAGDKARVMLVELNHTIETRGNPIACH